MEDVLKILNAGLEAVDGRKVVFESLKRSKNNLKVINKEYDLGNFKNIYILGIGKVAGRMAQGVEEVLRDKITSGLIVAKEKTKRLKKIKQIQGSHPVPNGRSLKAGKQILALAKKAKANDLVIFLLSGGASSLAVAPKGVNLKDKQKITKLLLECGADIKEINTIRKHLSAIKGGNLAKIIYPATCIVLIISDVLGNDFSFIGSGPTAPDKTTFKDCLEILEKYDLKNKAPKIYKYFKSNQSSKDRPSTEYFKKTFNFIVADLDKALRSSEMEARKLGYKVKILPKVTGIASKEGEKLAKRLKDLKNKTCLISGGETRVVITGKGRGGPASRRLSNASRGGRNLELVLGFLKQITKGVTLSNFGDVKKVRVLSVNTDGDDGTSGVAGAVVGEKELRKALKSGLNFDKILKDNNSLEFFQKVGGILKFPQRTNVGDIQILIKK